MLGCVLKILINFDDMVTGRGGLGKPQNEVVAILRKRKSIESELKRDNLVDRHRARLLGDLAFNFLSMGDLDEALLLLNRKADLEEEIGSPFLEGTRQKIAEVELQKLGVGAAMGHVGQMNVKSLRYWFERAERERNHDGVFAFGYALVNQPGVSDTEKRRGFMAIARVAKVRGYLQIELAALEERVKLGSNASIDRRIGHLKAILRVG